MVFCWHKPINVSRPFLKASSSSCTLLTMIIQLIPSVKSLCRLHYFFTHFETKSNFAYAKNLRRTKMIFQQLMINTSAENTYRVLAMSAEQINLGKNHFIRQFIAVPPSQQAP